MTILITLLVALIGVLFYALSKNPKVQEIGRIAYFCGLLVTLFNVAREAVEVLR